MRHRRLHRCAGRRPDPAGRAGAAGVPRLRLRGRRGRHPQRPQDPQVAGPGGRPRRRAAGAVQGRAGHRAHALGDPRRAHRGERPPAHRHRRPDRRGAQRDHRERGRAARQADRGRRRVHARRPTPRSSRTSSRPPSRPARRTSSRRSARRCAASSGAYGIAVLDAEHPDRIVVARNGSPVLLGVGEREMFVASDVAALVGYTRQVVYLDDGELATITAGAATAPSPSTTGRRPRARDDRLGHHRRRDRRPRPLPEKEIAEQPRTIERTLRGRLDERFSTAPRRAQPVGARGPRVHGA